MPASDRERRYDAFISYCHVDRTMVKSVHRGLHLIGRKLGQRSALNVYRDDTNLELSPNLWGRVSDAMDNSRWLIAVLSPAAASSVWCRREIQHWLDAQGSSQLLLVLVNGSLVWDEEGHCFDAALSTAAPEVLTRVGAFDEEPLFLDLTGESSPDVKDVSFRDKLTAVAAPIHGVPRAELGGVDKREQARARGLRRVAVGALVALTVLSLVSAGFALVQRREAVAQRDLAVEQARLAVARDLASRAERLAPTDIGMARLFATQAWSMADDPLTRAGLFTTLTASPELVRQHHFEDAVGEVVMSPDLSRVVAVLRTGEVVTQGSGSTENVTVGEIPGQAVRLRTSSDGSTVAIRWVSLLSSSENTRGVALFKDRVKVTLPQGADDLAVAPDGQSGIYLIDVTPDGYESATIEGSQYSETGIYDVHAFTLGPEGIESDTVVGQVDLKAEDIELTADSRLVLLQAAAQTTALTNPVISTYTLSPFEKISTANAGVAPMRRNPGVLSAGGSYFFSGATIMPADLNVPQSTIDEPAEGLDVEPLPASLGTQPLLAVSPDGKRVVGALSNELTVQTFNADDQAPTTTTIPGSSQITSVSMPDSRHIVSADGKIVSVWNPDAPASLVTENLIEGPEIGCAAENCVPTGLHPNEDGTLLATEAFLETWLINTTTNDATLVEGDSFLSWQNNDTYFTLSYDDVVQKWQVGNTKALGSNALNLAEGEAYAGAAFSEEDDELIIATTNRIIRIDADTNSMTSTGTPRAVHDLSPDGTRVITQVNDDSRQAQVEDIAFTQVYPGRFDSIAFTGEHQAVSSSDPLTGSPTFTVLDEDGNESSRVEGRYYSEIVVSSDGTYIVSQPSARKFTVTSAETGTPLRVFPAHANAGSASSAAFSDDGLRLFLIDVSPERYGVARLRTIDLHPTTWVERVCDTVNRSLTLDEWRDVTDLDPVDLVCEE